MRGDRVECTNEARAVTLARAPGDNRYDVLHGLQLPVIPETHHVRNAGCAVGREQHSDVDNSLRQCREYLRLALQWDKALYAHSVDIAQTDEAIRPLRAFSWTADDDAMREIAEVAHRVERAPLRDGVRHHERVLILRLRRRQDVEMPWAERDRETCSHRGDVVAVDLGVGRSRFQCRAEILGHDVDQALAERGLHELTRTYAQLETDRNIDRAEGVGIDASDDDALDEIERADNDLAMRLASSDAPRTNSQTQTCCEEHCNNSQHATINR